MSTPNRPDHVALAETLRRAVLEGPGITDPALRRAVAETAAGEPTAKPPYDELARQIGAAADRVTDEQVEAVVKAAGSEKAAFEIIAAAAVGAGLLRWRQALKATKEASNAPA
ncbi:MAG TPA: hypothetical protein VGP48_14245 [Stellaceae bacterium]|jgi:hypothetical protein|nr:hypothetical protein [Stellaceae bacterium]